MVNQYRKQSTKLLLLALLALGITFYSAPASAQQNSVQGADPDGIEALQEVHTDQVEVSIDRATDVATFVRIPQSAGSTRALDGRSPQESAAQFIGEAGQFCGNKAIDTAESCDDGNTEDGDGCSSICLIEDNYACELPTAGANVVQDGSFEAGTPNPVWTESSTNFGTPLCDGGCGGPGGTDGDWYVWFGGVIAFEEGSMEQTVMIPDSATSLDFDLWVGGCNSDSPEDGLSVLIDDSELLTTVPCTVGSGYDRQSIDISNYADGSMHTVRFEALNVSPNGASSSNIFVDNVTISDNLATGSICMPTGKVIISESEGVSDVVEGSADSAGYTVVLNSKPESEVIIQTVEHQNQVNRSPEEIVFDASNWNVPQLIKVTGVADDVEEGVHEAYIWHRVKSSDPQYGDDVPFSGNGYTAQSDPRTVLVYISDPSENAAPTVSASMFGQVAQPVTDQSGDDAEMLYHLYIAAISQ